MERSNLRTRLCVYITIVTCMHTACNYYMHRYCVKHQIRFYRKEQQHFVVKCNPETFVWKSLEIETSWQIDSLTSVFQNIRTYKTFGKLAVLVLNHMMSTSCLLLETTGVILCTSFCWFGTRIGNMVIEMCRKASCTWQDVFHVEYRFEYKPEIYCLVWIEQDFNGITL